MPARDATKNLRAQRREEARERLRAAGIAFEERHYGSMFIVAERWILWPGVGIWRPRKGSAHDNAAGLDALIETVRRHDKTA